jgi:hypothetical protein
MNSIKAHCMGTEFPKRDTDSPNVKWLHLEQVTYSAGGNFLFRAPWSMNYNSRLPSAADLDAVAEEQRAKENARGNAK